MNKKVIIVAAGTGSRMGVNIPKQFIPLKNLPVLMHTINRFFQYDGSIQIILVLAESEINSWESLKEKYSFNTPHSVVAGGANRYQSVKNGLEFIKEHCIVAVHDGVRPLCTVKLIERCFIEASKNSNAIPAIHISETVRIINGEKNSLINREYLRIIQTPQCFDSIKLKKAYQNSSVENFTDDAGVFEQDGNKIHLVEGERNNIKITLKEDLVFAEMLINRY